MSYDDNPKMGRKKFTSHETSQLLDRVITRKW